MAIEVFNRYEHKYILNAQQYRYMTEGLLSYMDVDAYNRSGEPYTIANLYYDTDTHELIQRSLEKPVYKEKLRLRAYGVPKEGTKVYLEIKKKFDGLVNKRRTALYLQEAYAFLKTGVPPSPKPYMNAQVLRELEYFLHLYALYPAVYIAYDRMAYFEKDNRDLRISFDQNIRTRRSELSLEAGTHGELLLEPGQYLMEIKTAFAKPLWLVRMLEECKLYRTSFSKYGTEFKNSLAVGKTAIRA